MTLPDTSDDVSDWFKKVKHKEDGPVHVSKIMPAVMHDIFQRVCKAKDMGVPETEYRFAPPRRWRFDYCWPVQKIALEVEGGVWTRGRHTRGAGYLKDIEKYNAAQLAGYIVLRTTPDKLVSAETVEMVQKAFELRRAA